MVVAAVALASLAQVLTGLGFALIGGPLLIVALGHAQGVRLTVGLSLLLNVAVLLRRHALVRWGDALRLLVPAVVVVVPAAVLAPRVDAAWVDTAAGAAVLAGVGLVAAGRRARWVQGPAGAVMAGVSSGVLNVLAGTSGLPVALFVAHRDWPGPVAAASVAGVRAAVERGDVGGARRTWRLGVVGVLGWWWLGVVGVAVGLVLAWPLSGRVQPGLLRGLVLGIAAAGGVLLILRART